MQIERCRTNLEGTWREYWPIRRHYKLKESNQILTEILYFSVKSRSREGPGSVLPDSPIRRPHETKDAEEILTGKSAFYAKSGRGYTLFLTFVDAKAAYP